MKIRAEQLTEGQTIVQPPSRGHRKRKKRIEEVIFGKKGVTVKLDDFTEQRFSRGAKVTVE